MLVNLFMLLVTNNITTFSDKNRQMCYDSFVIAITWLIWDHMSSHKFYNKLLEH